MGVNKKVIGKFKDELGGKIMKEFCGLRAKTYAYLLDDDNEMKKAKGINKCVIKRRLVFENYKDSLINNKIIMQLLLRFISDHHNVFTEEINKIALNSTDDKRIQTFDGIITYPHGASVFKVCENEMITVRNAKETLRKINEESEGELYVTCNTFLNYIKRKSTMEMKRHVKLPKRML